MPDGKEEMSNKNSIKQNRVEVEGDGGGRGRAKVRKTSDSPDNSSSQDANIVQFKPREDQDITTLTDLKVRRHEREINLLNQIDPEQIEILSRALQILSETKSTWIVNIFKLASSTRSTELSDEYSEPEMSFEVRGKSWSEIWRNPALKKKVYETCTERMLDLPLPLIGRFALLAKRIAENRKKGSARKRRLLNRYNRIAA